MEILVLAKLVRSQAVSLAAARGSMSLIERGFSRYGHPWDKPAIAALSDGQCFGVLCLRPDEDEKSVTVCLAWCDPEHPEVLARLLLRLRQWCVEGGFSEVYFTCHDANDQMSKAASALNAQPYSHTYRLVL